MRFELLIYYEKDIIADISMKKLNSIENEMIVRNTSPLKS